MRLEKYTLDVRELDRVPENIYVFGTKARRERTNITKPRRAGMGSPKMLVIFGEFLKKPIDLGLVFC